MDGTRASANAQNAAVQGKVAKAFDFGVFWMSLLQNPLNFYVFVKFEKTIHSQKKFFKKFSKGKSELFL